MMSNLEKISKSKFEPDKHVLAMFLLWASRPSNAEPDETGRYFIGDCGTVPEKNWERPIGPYSAAQRFKR
jgi:hypothetical protein